MKNVHTLREIEDVTRRCHERLLETVMKNCYKTVGQIACFFGFPFFICWRKTDEDCDLASEVNLRNVNVNCGCGKSSLSLMNFTEQCFGYKSTALPYHIIRLFESGLGMYFCWNLKQVLRHTILSGVMSVRRHTSLTLSNELYLREWDVKPKHVQLYHPISFTIRSVYLWHSLLPGYGEYVRKDLDIVIKGGEKLLFLSKKHAGKVPKKGPPRDN